MPSPILGQQAAAYVRSIPDIQPGYTVRVHERIQEGDKSRTQVFEGLVISVHRGHVATDRSFTVRRVVSGVGVEMVFPMYATTIEKIEVKKIAEARRAKLFFLRGRSGKSARLNERFTKENEFGDIAVPSAEVPQQEEAVVPQETEAPAPEAATPEVASVAEAAPAAEEAKPE